MSDSTGAAVLLSTAAAFACMWGAVLPWRTRTRWAKRVAPAAVGAWAACAITSAAMGWFRQGTDWAAGMLHHTPEHQNNGVEILGWSPFHPVVWAFDVMQPVAEGVFWSVLTLLPAGIAWVLSIAEVAEFDEREFARKRSAELDRSRAAVSRRSRVKDHRRRASFARALQSGAHE